MPLPNLATVFTLFSATTIAALAMGCSGSPNGASRPVAFHGSTNPIPGFDYDTGWIPSSGPLAVDVAAHASGATTVDAGATLKGGALEPAPGSGKLALSLSFGISGKLNVNQDGLTYMGPIPGLANLAIAFSGTQTFDPFLIGGMATVTASPTTTMLPPIDLTPVGLPGATLNLTLDAASQVTSTFRGTCTGVNAGRPQYVGQLSTAGTLKLHASLAFSLLGVSKSLDLPTEISVPIPTTAQTIAMSPDGPDAGDPAASSCASAADAGGTDAGTLPDSGPAAIISDAAAGADADSAVTASDGATSATGMPPTPPSADGGPPPACFANAPFTPLPWAPPTPFGQTACTAPQMASYIACLMSATGDCSAFRSDAANASCVSCIETDVSAAAHGPILTSGGQPIDVNWGGCQASYDGQPGANGCGEQVNDGNDCVLGECGTCTDIGNPAAGGPFEQCMTSALAGQCSAYMGTPGCEAETNDGGIAAVCNDVTQFLPLWCGGG